MEVDEEDEDEEEEEETEVDFPKLRVKPPKPPIGVKNINLIRALRRGKNKFAEIAARNRMARQGVFNETHRGWMAKPICRQDENNRIICRAMAGFQALRKIRFYQKSTCFLIPMFTFQRYVREVALDFKIGGSELRWQARALYALQEAAEAYLVAFLVDANLLTMHVKRYTLIPKDFYLVNRI